MLPMRNYLFGLVVLLATGLFAAQSSMAGSDHLNLAPLLEGKGEQCVEPTDVMRTSHFEFLLHQRDETVKNGVRTKEHSLKNCVSCHANKDDQGHYIPVNAEGQFCNVCHQATSVSIDCFQCHATKPRDKK